MKEHKPKIKIHKDFYKDFDEEEALDDIRDTLKPLDVGWSVFRIDSGHIHGWAGRVGEELIRNDDEELLFEERKDLLRRMQSRANDHLAERN